MELNLDSTEVTFLREVLQKEKKELLFEIANTDHRRLRAELVEREGLLEGLLERLALPATFTPAEAA